MLRKLKIPLIAFSFLGISGFLWYLTKSGKKEEKRAEKAKKKPCDCGCKGQRKLDGKVRKIIGDDDNHDSYNSTIPMKKRNAKKTKRSILKTNNQTLTTRNHQLYTKYQSWSDQLAKEFSITQVTVTNTSSQSQTVSLWGADNHSFTTISAPEQVENHMVVATSRDQPITSNQQPTIVHPQGIAINPVNGLAYVANQLSNNISVIATSGQITSVIPLQPTNLPGYTSPVAVAVHTKAGSPNYGKIYVAGSVSNTITIIDLQHQITTTIPVGNRPVALAFNPINEQLYVANLADDSITVIDTATETITTTLPIGKGPRAIAVHPNSGDVYVVNTKEDTISVFDNFHDLITVIRNVGIHPVNIAYHPTTNEMYVVSNGSNAVFPIDTLSYLSGTPIGVGDGPNAIAYNPYNNYLYIGNRNDQTFTILAPDKLLRATIPAPCINIGMAFHPTANLLFSTDTHAGTVNIIGYANQNNHLTINESYAETNRNFQHCPALVKHVKFVLSGTDRFKLLKVKDQNATGKEEHIPISLGNYNSPQNFQNVAELFEMDGSIIDGKISWLFPIAPKQTITVLVYYKQFKMYNLLKQGNRNKAIAKRK